MGSFRQNAQAAGGDADHDFQGGDGHGRQHRIGSHSALFRAHGFGAEHCRCSRHECIIAATIDSRQDAAKEPRCATERIAALC